MSLDPLQLREVMKVLVLACFGLGNSILKIPMIRAFAARGFQVDILCGTGPDDFGAKDVFTQLQACSGGPPIGNVWFDRAPTEFCYEVAIRTIPFDGRWKNGQHFNAMSELDGRTRPDPSTTGLSSWKKHEVLYQMENVRQWLYWNSCEDETDEIESHIESHLHDTWFLEPACNDHIFLGIGYKRDKDGFWKQKHWGNEKFSALINLIHERTDRKVLLTGSPQDHAECIRPIVWAVKDKRRVLLEHSTQKLLPCMRLAAGAAAYVGNDTGMMHVAAAHGVSTVGIFRLEHLVTKNHPWGTKHWKALEDLDGSLSPEDVFSSLEAILCRSSSQAEQGSSDRTSSGS
jgi:hypothetical protein